MVNPQRKQSKQKKKREEGRIKVVPDSGPESSSPKKKQTSKFRFKRLGRRKARKGRMNTRGLSMNSMGASVATLVEAHAAQLKLLAAEVDADLEASCDVLTPLDELFLLRYLLSSKGDVAKAAASLRGGLAWRQEHAEELRIVIDTHSFDGFSMIRRHQLVRYTGTHVKLRGDELADVDLEVVAEAEAEAEAELEAEAEAEAMAMAEEDTDLVVDETVDETDTEEEDEDAGASSGGEGKVEEKEEEEEEGEGEEEGPKHPVFIVRAGLTNLKELMADQSVEDVAMGMLLSRELAFQFCDAETRRTGRLAKLVNIVDAKSANPFNLDLGFPKAVGKASFVSKDAYPSLVGLQILTNIPLPVRFVVNLVSKLQSKAIQEKQVTWSPSQIAEHLDPEDLPDFLGGALPMCAAHTPFAEREGVSSHTIGAGDTLETALVVDAAEGDTEHDVFVDSKLLGLGDVTVTTRIDGVEQVAAPVPTGRKAFTVRVPAAAKEQRVEIIVANAQDTPCDVTLALRAPLLV